MAANFNSRVCVRTAAISACLTLTVTPGSALDLCVSCEGPAVHYNCRLDTPFANARDLRLQLICITELAHGGGHASCAVDKAQQNPCPGETKVIAAPAGEIMPKAAAVPPAAPAPDAAKTAPAAPAATPPPRAAETAAPKPEAPPKTVQEMVEKSAANTGKNLEGAGTAVKDAAKSTGSTLEKAGAAVGNAAKKTWHCLATLFGEC